MQKKKILIILALLCTIVQGAWAQKFDVWDGVTTSQPGHYHKSGESSYTIEININSAAEMAWVMKSLTIVYYPWDDYRATTLPSEQNIHLNCDVDMTAGTWKGLYRRSNTHFYGNGHTIKIKISDVTDNYQGLFSTINEGATVTNLHVVADIHCKDSRLVGGICGENNGTIQYCCVTANVQNDDADVGGIVGDNSGHTISHCTFYGTRTSAHKQDNEYAGDDGTEEYCYTTFNQGEYDAASDKGLYRGAIKYMGLSSFTISNADEWNEFAKFVNYGCTLSGKNVKLTSDISVNDMVGTGDAYSFQGTFDGDGHMLTFTKGTSKSPFSEDYCAPFRHVKNATIKNLHVAGTIYTSKQMAAGLVGESHGALTISGCISSIAINSSKNGDGMMTAYENGILYDGKYYVAPEAITLADTETNDVDGIDGYFANVTLSDRTLYKDGDWNTLCLPFNIVLEGSTLEGATARPLESASISGTTLNLTFGTAVDALQAGTPYIIRWAEGDNIVNPVFSGVTISSAMHPYDSGENDGDKRVRFLGTYASQSFSQENRSILFMGAENKLYYPLDGASIGAQRAYFKIGEDGAQARQLTAFDINFGEGKATGVQEIVNGKSSNSKSLGVWYSLDGRRFAGKPSRAGVYIYNV